MHLCEHTHQCSMLSLLCPQASPKAFPAVPPPAACVVGSLILVLLWCAFVSTPFWVIWGLRPRGDALLQAGVTYPRQPNSFFYSGLEGGCLA
jgi:hypothetical protein